MKTTWKQLSRPLRLAVAAPWCLLAVVAAVAATPATRALLLDSAHQPTDDVSLSSPRWTGTLDDARLPANVLRLSDNNLHVPGDAYVDGYLAASVGGFNEIHSAGFAEFGSAYVDHSFFVLGDSETAGNVMASGYISRDSGYIVIDSDGAYFVGGNQVISATADGNFSGLTVNGPTFLDGGYVSTDGQGGLSVSGGFYLSGNLQLVGQAAVTETVAPDCTLIVYDTGGNAIKLLGHRQ